MNFLSKKLQQFNISDRFEEQYNTISNQLEERYKTISNKLEEYHSIITKENFVIKQMGCLMSTLAGAPAHLIDQVDGDEEAYHKRYLEDQVLGEGEFGVVKMVHDVTMAAQQQGDNVVAPLASKMLRKGAIFKDNILYSPLKPEVLRGEIEILRTLAGNNYCLKLQGIYETPKVLYMVTEYCGGGEMMEYVSHLEEDLRSEDVSRIAYQLLSAVDHCCKHNVIHRDIKPENIMFQDPLPNSPIRLIDFGSGVMDKNPVIESPDEPYAKHSTFAGSAFYISPEVFNAEYNVKADVWSAGVVLYVLVAGYPADCLQKAFNTLQTSKRSIREDLPNMPNYMPDSFYDLLEKLLVYRRKKRVTAGELLQHEFVKFHQEMLDQPTVLSINDVSAAAATTDPRLTLNGSISRQGSVALRGSVLRHAHFMGFRKFERSLTTLLATMLPSVELDKLLDILSKRTSVTVDGTISTPAKEEPIKVLSTQSSTSSDINKENNNSLNGNTNSNQSPESENNKQVLTVCKVSELKEIIKTEMNNDGILETMAKLPNSDMYNNFAYHIELLYAFSTQDSEKMMSSSVSVGRRSMRRRGSLKRANSFHGKTGGFRSSLMMGSNGSNRSASNRGKDAFFGKNNTNPKKGKVPASLSMSTRL